MSLRFRLYTQISEGVEEAILAAQDAAHDDGGECDGKCADARDALVAAIERAVSTNHPETPDSCTSELIRALDKHRASLDSCRAAVTATTPAPSNWTDQIDAAVRPWRELVEMARTDGAMYRAEIERMRACPEADETTDRLCASLSGRAFECESIVARAVNAGLLQQDAKALLEKKPCATDK